MKNLAQLKSICVHFRTLSEKNPESLHFKKCYRNAKYAVKMKESEVLCDVGDIEL
jgi:hypothetical protein